MSTTYSRQGAGAAGESAAGGRPPGDGRGPARTMWIIAGSAAVVGTIAGSALGLTRGGGSPDASTPVPTTSTAGPVATTSAAGKPAPNSSAPTAQASLSAVGEVSATGAASLLTASGVKVVGKPESAWQWTDANGQNMLVTTRQVTHTRPDKVVDGATLRVLQVAGIGTAKVVTLRTLVDPGAVTDQKKAICDADFTLDFVPGSVTVTDADGDGYGEASVGWWSMCRSDPGPAAVKLALLENGRYFILRGQGLLAADRAKLAPDLAALIPTVTFTPDPSSSRWPKGTYAPTVALFKQLYS